MSTTSTMHTMDVPVTSILESHNFSRSVYDPNAMEGLKKSITECGLLQPVGVSPNEQDRTKFDLVYGYRRFKAYLELKKANVPCVLVSKHPLSEQERMKLNVVENRERKDVSIIESGLRWRRLVETGAQTVKEISYLERIAEKKVSEAIEMYRLIPAKYMPLIVSNDSKADQKNLITQTKAHAVVTAIKYEGMSGKISELFELIRTKNASEKEILEVRKFVQTGSSVSDALIQVRNSKSKVMAKSLRFEVKKRAWENFRLQYGHDVSNVLKTAIKKGDKAVLADAAKFMT